ncbi:LptF/LptG family permease [candidate division GN15 bacterium]|nr:LptF/LptG family permease [candidate division GN15 bacterium]
MKILSRYILREHLAPFIFAFVTVTFLLVIDYVPRIVNQVIDKDLSVWVVLELIGLNLAWMLALSVPMAVLVATLMAFGRLGSDMEIIAMKASGVNLLRVLLPLLAAGCVITYLMVQFNDKILPDLNKEARQLSSDIRNMRPTLVFRSGVFINDIPGYQILVDDIDHSTSRVEGVRISDTRVDERPRLIVADSGYLKVTDRGRNLQFSLYDGEVHLMDLTDPANYRKAAFKHQEINVAGDPSELIRTERDYRTDREMGIDMLQERVDQAEGAIIPLQGKIEDSFREKATFLLADPFEPQSTDITADSIAFLRLKNEVAGWHRLVERNREQIAAQKKIMGKFDLEIHKKYSIPAASLAFILIGAPLGILAKRGGMGAAIAYSILLFIVYWAFLIGGEDLADRGLVSPFWAMWSANFLIGAIGLYLLYLVLTEKPLFSWFRRIG